MQGFWFQSSRSWLWPSGWPQNISTTLNCCMWYSGKDWLHDWWRLQNVAINSKVIFVREIINKPHHEQQRIYSIESGGLFHPILLTHPYTLKEKVKKKMGVRMKGTLIGGLPPLHFNFGTSKHSVIILAPWGPYFIYPHFFFIMFTSTKLPRRKYQGFIIPFWNWELIRQITSFVPKTLGDSDRRI